MKYRLPHLAAYWLAAVAFIACSDKEIEDNPLQPEQPAGLAELTTQYNANISAYRTLMDGKAEVINYTSSGEGGYKLQLSDGQTVDVSASTQEEKDIPLFSIDKEGYWVYQLEGSLHPLADRDNNPVPALRKTGKPTFTPQIALGKDGYWQISYNGNQWSRLGTVPVPTLEGKTAADFFLFTSVLLNEESQTMALTPRAGDNILLVDIHNDGTAQAWKKYLMQTEDNVLTDYSYAGYDRGESAPKDGFAWGYKVCNVKQRMEQDGLTALEAFTRILDENRLIRKSSTNAQNPTANIVIYFPEGEYIMHEGAGKNFPYTILGGNFIIKGDGPTKTRLVMKSPNGDTEATHAPLLAITHTNSPNNNSNSAQLATVLEDAKKGTFSVKVSSTVGLKAGKWVQLRLRSGDKELVSKELGPITPGADWSINMPPVPITESGADNYGVKITEFHQIKSVGSDYITFYEPLLHDVEVKYNDCLGWEIRDYKYYENVGVEDLSFICQARTPYYHHGYSTETLWLYDEEYRPLTLGRLVNSWVRNVDFESVSEALTIGESANCSAYNITIRGNRGHSSVRAAGSSRVFIGNIADISRDAVAISGRQIGEGQWHGCGVSKPSIGTVIWNSTWGKNSCFESHCTQPRVTLFDGCSGGLLYYHAGGAEQELPTHLGGLVIWNLNATGTTDERNRDYATDFYWWSNSDKNWKTYPPVVVGTHGAAVMFSKGEQQFTYEESTGMKVSPESLYEAQLEKRLGFVPGWLKTLK